MNQPSSIELADVVVDMALVLAVGALLAWPARRIRQPAVIAEIVAGIILGPSLLGLLPGNPTAWLFPTDVRPLLSGVAEVGIVLFMFLAGWELEIGLVRSRVKTVFSVSTGSMMLPFVSGFVLALWLYHDHAFARGHHIARLSFLLFVGTAMAITAFPVLARIILEHRLQLTPIGALALTCAAVADVLAWCMLAVVSALVTAHGTADVVRVLGLTALYALVLGVAVRPLMKRITAYLTRDGGVSPRLLPVIVIGVFFSAYASTWIGLDAIFGGFAFGLVVPRTPSGQLESALGTPLRHIAGLLMPIFFVITGLSVNVTTLGLNGFVELLAITAVACLGKFLGASLPARLSGLAWRDAAVLGTLLNTRGLTELVVLNVGVRLGVLDTRMLTMMVVMAIVTTGMAGPLVPRRRYARAAETPTTPEATSATPL